MYYLVAYWVVFWRKFLANPFLLCTSEIASTYFPHWLWMGRELRAGRFPSQDDIYYKMPASIPFLSTFYPPNLLTAYIGSFLSMDIAFKLYSYTILAHYLLCSLLAYWLTGSLFFAITITYAGYCIKPMTPCFAYTATWMPLMLMKGHISWIACTMAVAGGYWPILVYFLPVVAILNPACLIGLLFALPQILPFIGYWKRSVRAGQKVDGKLGRVPILKLADLFVPSFKRETTSGVIYPEMAMYLGISPLLLSCNHWWALLVFCGILIAIGLIPAIQRIPARVLFLLTLAIAFSSSSNLSELPHLYTSLTIFQGFLLLRNASLYPSFPFSQWWNKPSVIYSRKPKMSNWPNVTGYLHGRRTSEYAGAFRLVS